MQYPQKYTKKPVTIEAIQWTGDNTEAIKVFCGNIFGFDEGSVNIKTLEGLMTASVGDYIIKGIKGEFYPCKPDIFEASYDHAK